MEKSILITGATRGIGRAAADALVEYGWSVIGVARSAPQCFRIGPGTFGIFDTFRNEDGRSAHINGEVAKALFARAEELFVTHPEVQMIDILAEKN